jgi:hypothetical protein
VWLAIMIAGPSSVERCSAPRTSMSGQRRWTWRSMIQRRPSRRKARPNLPAAHRWGVAFAPVSTRCLAPVAEASGMSPLRGAQSYAMKANPSAPKGAWALPQGLVGARRGPSGASASCCRLTASAFPPDGHSIRRAPHGHINAAVASGYRDVAMGVVASRWSLVAGSVVVGVMSAGGWHWALGGGWELGGHMGPPLRGRPTPLPSG